MVFPRRWPDCMWLTAGWLLLAHRLVPSWQVGEEDHLRIMCMKKGSILNEVGAFAYLLVCA